MAGPKVTLSCPGCARSVQQERHVLLKRLTEGKPIRCVYCAHDLVVPEDLRVELEAPEENTVRGRCPACLRPARAVGNAAGRVGTCVNCAVRFRCDGPGHGSFDFPAAQPATADEVESCAPVLAKLPEGDVLTRALRRRQALGALEAGEASALANGLQALKAWRSPDDREWPLSARESLHLLGPIVLGAQTAVVDEARGEVKLTNSMVIDGKPNLSLSPTQRGVINAIGFGMLMTTGSGFSVSARDEEPDAEHLTRHLYLSLAPSYRSPHGWELRGSFTENGSVLRSVDPDELVEIVRRAFGLREQLARYLRLRCLCGVAVRGFVAKRVTREGLLGRLVELGAGAAEAQRASGSFLLSGSPP